MCSYVVLFFKIMNQWYTTSTKRLIIDTNRIGDISRNNIDNGLLLSLKTCVGSDSIIKSIIVNPIEIIIMQLRSNRLIKHMNDL